MQKPNFLIIGAPKAGTTSLYHYLGQHPEIEFASIKEPKYFSYKNSNINFQGNPLIVNRVKKSIVFSENDYFNLFKNLNSTWVGEASPNYFHDQVAAKNIFHYNPHIRLLVILRNPVERLYSDWKHNVRMGLEPELNFAKALKLIEKRKKNNEIPYYDYLSKGNYATQLKRWYKYFDANQLKIIFYEDFVQDSNRVCNDILLFLNITKGFDFQNKIIYLKNEYTPKYSFIFKVSKRIRRINPTFSRFLDYVNAIPKEMPTKSRQFAGNYYREEILELEKMTNRNLKKWLDY